MNEFKLEKRTECNGLCPKCCENRKKYKVLQKHWFQEDLDEKCVVGKVKNIKSGEILSIKWMYDCPVVILSNNETCPIPSFHNKYELVNYNFPLTNDFESQEMQIKNIFGLELSEIQKMINYFALNNIKIEDLK